MPSESLAVNCLCPGKNRNTWNFKTIPCASVDVSSCNFHNRQVLYGMCLTTVATFMITATA